MDPRVSCKSHRSRPWHHLRCEIWSKRRGQGLVPTNLFMYAADNLSAYAVFGHRHTGELLEQLNLKEEQIQFTPHLLPIPRGILSTIYVRLNEQADRAKIQSILDDFYSTLRWFECAAHPNSRRFNT